MMKRYLKLLRQSTELWIIALLLAAATVVGIYTRFIRPGDTLDQNWQDGFIALFVTLLVLLIFEFVKIHRLYNRYKVYEGEYKGYGYVLNDPSEKSDARYDELSSSPVSKASVQYVGGNDFTLELSNPASGRITHTWRGSLKMTSDNMADIGYKYTKWPDGANLKHSAGYKRAIISEDEKGVYITCFRTITSALVGRCWLKPLPINGFHKAVRVSLESHPQPPTTQRYLLKSLHPKFDSGTRSLICNA